MADLRIGVVGAGVGGAFTAKFLREFGVNATIEVFDANERAGGRVLDTTTLLGEPLAQELGASMAITHDSPRQQDPCGSQSSGWPLPSQSSLEPSAISQSSG